MPDNIQIQHVKTNVMEAPIRIIGFCCRNAFESDPILVEKGWHAYEPEITILSVPCSSKVETLSIIKAFESGVDGIFVLGCKKNTCRFLDGNLRAQRTIDYTKKLLSEIDIDTNRLFMVQLGSDEFKDFEHVAHHINELIRSLGKVS
jgi:coenzyme F420-reducing hydrogenase delta subunit